MNLSQFIINDIKPLLNTDNVSELQLMFNQLTYSHIPIKNDEDVYLGCISETIDIQAKDFLLEKTPIG